MKQKFPHVTAKAVILALTLSTAAAAPLAFREGKRPDDRRLGKPRTTDDSEFPMQPVTNINSWPVRRDEIRLRVLVAAGLHPLPPRSPLHATIFGKVERDDYTVERVLFESFPGHYVSGSLYRPKSPRKGKLPAVLNPHGHWKDGRFYDGGAELVQKQIAAGAERFEMGGRYIIQARCVQLARMGCIAFVYDMEGYADSVQLSHNAGPRPDEQGEPGYLFFSPLAELHGQTMFGLQTWNSIRALDFICSLPEVDTKRIGLTGASGGGTQSMILSAIDGRIAASCPVSMVSTSRQGGCICENAAYLRINQGNVDIAAATAPRPIELICADDWTKELQTKGHPDLKQLYEMLGRPDHYQAYFHLEFPHNYNAVNRQHMYDFMNRHLKLGLPEPVVERDFVPLDRATEASVWTAQHPKPAGDNLGDAHERKLTAQWTKATEAALVKLNKNNRRRIIAEGLTTMVGRLPAQVGPVKWHLAHKSDAGDCLVTTGTLSVTRHGEQLPALFIYPKENGNRQVAIWLTDTGKDALFDTDSKPVPGVAALLHQGYGVAAIDMFGQGEFVGSDGGRAIQSVRLVPRGKGKDPYQKAACYTFGYNSPLVVQRVHDVMSLAAFLQREKGDPKVECIHLVALGQQAGPVGLLARFMLGDRIAKAAVDTQGFDFSTVDRLDHPMFFPGILRYGGVEALWELNRPLSTATLHGADTVAGVLKTKRQNR